MIKDNKIIFLNFLRSEATSSVLPISILVFPIVFAGLLLMKQK